MNFSPSPWTVVIRCPSRKRSTLERYEEGPLSTTTSFSTWNTHTHHINHHKLRSRTLDVNYCEELRQWDNHKHKKSPNRSDAKVRNVQSYLAYREHIYTLAGLRYVLITNWICEKRNTLHTGWKEMSLTDNKSHEPKGSWEVLALMERVWTSLSCVCVNSVPRRGQSSSHWKIALFEGHTTGRRTSVLLLEVLVLAC